MEYVARAGQGFSNGESLAVSRRSPRAGRIDGYKKLRGKAIIVLILYRCVLAGSQGRFQPPIGAKISRIGEPNPLNHPLLKGDFHPHY